MIEGKQQLVLNIPADLKAWLKQKAQEEQRSVNYVASQALQQARKAEKAVA